MFCGIGVTGVGVMNVFNDDGVGVSSACNG